MRKKKPILVAKKDPTPVILDLNDENRKLRRENDDLKAQEKYRAQTEQHIREENRRLNAENTKLMTRNETLVTSEKNLREALDATSQSLSCASRAIGNLNGVDAKPEKSFHPFMSPFLR